MQKTQKPSWEVHPHLYTIHICLYLPKTKDVSWKYHMTSLFSCNCCLVTQLCPTVCNPMDCSPPGSSVHGILQARILVWDAMPSSRESSRIRDQTHISCIRKVGSLSLSHQKSPYLYLFTFKTNFSYEKFLILLSSLSSPSPLLCGWI